jgi:RNA polymerase sigma factor (sigma-70 family)
MVKPLLNNLRHWFRRVTPASSAEETDRQLLERFARQRDESAFGVLVGRHGSMVLGVCRRLLYREQDAEDAFQATFLVLTRRADSVRWQDDIANWLYTVACRVARKLRSGLTRRRETAPPSELVGAEPAPSADLDRQELRSILDEEVGRLPEKYRAPVVLCYLEGKSYGEAARLLGWAEGTVSGRLARARDVLRGRLMRRGLAPTGAALIAVLAPEVVSASLAAATTLAAQSFASGHAAVAPRSAELAEGVLRTMTYTKIKMTVVLLLAVGLVGTGVGVLANHARPDKDPKASKDGEPARRTERPPLPEAWKGRWQADPFAGTTSIEVWHTGPHLAKSYQLKDPRTVASLLAKLKITSIQNDIARGNKPTARLTFHKKGGEDLRVWVANDGTLQLYMAEVHVQRAFFDALHAHLAAIEGRAVNLMQPPPGSELPPPNQPRPRIIPPSLRALQGDWKELSTMYTVGGRLHEATVADAGVLKRLRQSFQVVAHQADQGRKGLPFPTVNITCADGSTARAHVLSDTQLFVWDVGLLTVKPSFAQALGKELGRLEGRPMTLRGENRLTDKQVARERDFRRLLAEARSLRYRDRQPRLDVAVKQQEDVTRLLKELSWAEVPLRPLVRAKVERVVELTTASGKKVRLTWLNTDSRAGGGFLPILAWRDGALWMKTDGAVPLAGDLVEVSGFGQVWLDGQWKYRIQQYTAEQQMKAQQRRAEETTRRVAADLPAFLRQVKNVEIISGDPQARELLSAEASRPVLEALKIDRVEKLDWTPARWKKTLAKLDKADELLLTPGVGFSLSLIVSGDREMLIPGYGRVTLKNSPRETIRKAAEGDGKDNSLVPGGP